MGDPHPLHGSAGESGQSPLTAVFSVGVFLLFLLLSAQVLLHLYTASVVTSAAHDAVRVATGAASGVPGERAAIVAAEQRANRLLGELEGPDGGPPELDWDLVERSSGTRRLSLTITVASPSVAVRGLVLGAVERTAVSTIEESGP